MDRYDYLVEFLTKIGMKPNEMTQFIGDAKLLINEFGDQLEELIDYYKKTVSMNDCEKLRTELSEKSGISIFTTDAVFIILLTPWLLDRYKEKGLSEELYFETIGDIKYKMEECKQVKKVWGIFVPGWYTLFFSMKIFKLGRLEYELSTFNKEKPYTVGGQTINPNDKILNVHIPSGAPLTKELRIDSYKRAYEFFKAQNTDKPLLLMCNSWLLFEGNKEIFPPHLNMVDFINDWKIILSYESEKFNDAWRVFGRDYNGNVDELPQNTSAQRAMAKWLKDGKKTGYGSGIMAFDGQKIITE